jgi:hypothetical protein
MSCTARCPDIWRSGCTPSCSCAERIRRWARSTRLTIAGAGYDFRMSFSTLATVAVGLALVAVTIAGLAGILVRLRRREQANRAFALVVVLFAAATASAFGAAARSGSDLQVETRAVLSLAASAERIVHARSGRYTVSIAYLERISPALADQISLDAAHVSAGPRAPIRRVRLRVWIGASKPAVRVLTAIAR